MTMFKYGLNVDVLQSASELLNGLYGLLGDFGIKLSDSAKFDLFDESGEGNTVTVKWNGDEYVVIGVE